MNFTGEMLQITCSCGESAYIFVEDILKSYRTKCWKCSRYIYQLTCTKCKSGFGIPDGDKHLIPEKNQWKCAMCKQFDDFLPDTYPEIPNYQKAQIPPEILAKSKPLLPVWVSVLMIILFMAFMVWKIFFTQ